MNSRNLSLIIQFSDMYFLQTHSVGADLPAVGVHAGHEVDPGAVDQVPDVLVAADVAVAEVLRQVEQQLAAQDLVAVHVGDVLDLRLHC